MFLASLRSPHLKFKIQSGAPCLPVQGGAFGTSCWTSSRNLLSGRPMSVVLVLSPGFTQQSEEHLPDPVILLLTASERQGSWRWGGSRCGSSLSASAASKPRSPPWGAALLGMAPGPQSSGRLLTTVDWIGLSTRPAVGAAQWGSQCCVTAQR